MSLNSPMTRVQHLELPATPSGSVEQSNVTLSLERESSEMLMQRRIEYLETVRELRRIGSQIDLILNARIQALGQQEIVDGDYQATLKRGDPFAKIDRDWLLDLLFDHTITKGEAQGLIHASVEISQAGWKMLDRRGLKPEQHGECGRKPDGVDIKRRK